MLFERDMYRAMMNLEIEAIGKEMTSLNCVISKQKRLLKSFTSDSVFKICIGFLVSSKASGLIKFGKRNEDLWKAALLAKKECDASLDKWMKFVKSVVYDDGSSIVREFAEMNC